MNRRFFNKLLSLAPFLPYVKTQDDLVVGYSDGSGWVILSEEYPKNGGYELLLNNNLVSVKIPNGQIYTHGPIKTVDGCTNPFFIKEWIEFSDKEIVDEMIGLEKMYEYSNILHKIHITLSNKHRLLIITNNIISNHIACTNPIKRTLKEHNV